MVRCEAAARRRAAQLLLAQVENRPNPVEPPSKATKVGRQPVPAGVGPGFVDTTAGQSGSLLSPVLLDLVQERAAAAGQSPGDWLARAVRAYAKAPLTHAQRQRAYRERQRGR